MNTQSRNSPSPWRGGVGGLRRMDEKARRPVGRVNFVTGSGFPLKAVLYHDGWECPGFPPLEQYLNQFYRPDGSPAHGPWGTSELMAAAQTLGGTFALGHLHPPNPDVVS